MPAQNTLEKANPILLTKHATEKDWSLKTLLLAMKTNSGNENIWEKCLA